MEPSRKSGGGGSTVQSPCATTPSPTLAVKTKKGTCRNQELLQKVGIPPPLLPNLNSTPKLSV